jgi:propanol-preferring alcohol dehydrogenase
VADEVKEITRGRGVSAAFDFVGSEATLSLAVSATRSLGKVSQIGLAGGTARMKVLENTRFEVQFEATLWGTVKELREVVALVEAGRLTPIPTELAPLEKINDIHARLERGEISGRAVITPAA